MSLLQSCNNGSSGQSYFIQNIGFAGGVTVDAPCIQGSTLGAVRVGNPASGLVIRGDTVANANNIRGGQVSGGTFQLGNSTTSFQNIVLTDGVTTVNGTLATAGAVTVLNGLSVSGDITLLQGAAGDSISGYYTQLVPVLGSGPVINPIGLTQGLYNAAVVPTNAADRLASPSGLFYWSGAEWSGNAVSSAFSAGVPNCVISPVAGLATLEVTGTGVPAGQLVFSKLLN
jgi:hypothetical protein